MTKAESDGGQTVSSGVRVGSRGLEFTCLHLRVMQQPLNDADVEHFRRSGWLLTSPFTEVQADELRQWVTDIQSWAIDNDAGKWLHYQERTDNGPKLCRTENFTPFHEGMKQVLREGILSDIASQLLGEKAVLYKEKINYKLAGGAGYAPHQDAPAYRFVDTHVSCMIAIDDADANNGCLEVVDAMHADVLPMDNKGCIAETVVNSMTWRTVPVRAGEVLWFHSCTPHRSGANVSTSDRRAIYPTYNASREGDLREAYYAQKSAEFRARGNSGENVQVSLIGDFQGIPV